MTYGIISDTHNHNWQQFATTCADGINSRLRIILDETIRAAQTVKDAGGDMLYHAGDLFHVRGNISPSVLNPTIEAYRYIINDIGIQVAVIPGNHDLETKDSSFYMNASSALLDIGVQVAHESKLIGDVLMVPWHSVESLKIALSDLAANEWARGADLIIHAPVNGVIMGIPDHGLDAGYLADIGFKRVFAGHYHNHKDFGNGVYSVGALTHQTWGDVGSKAGFLLVTDDEVKYNASHAPEFIDLDPTWKEEDIPLIVDGHYVRAKTKVSKESDIARLREFLEKAGSHGVVIHPVREPKNAANRSTSVSAGASTEASVDEFIKTKGYPNVEKLSKLCNEIIAEVN